ncbi:DNA-processing protein DprA, partial [Desulfovibrio sp. OttesenSCG-928-C14]|nr:DNA-processing protein DprA [Desulfovibrio sp. OttesenSCG-928-C14]
MRFQDLDDSFRAELWASLALLNVEGIGAARRKRLVDRFGSPYQAVLAAKSWAVSGLGISQQSVNQFQSDRWRDKAKEDWERIKKSQERILLYSDPRYPKALKQTADAPLFLFHRGDVSLLGNPSVAVVGARKCTEEGMAVAVKIVRGLSDAGITAISGLALGIDRIVHLAGLDGVGSSIAVLGCGIDVAYPKVNLDLYRKMEEGGLLLSEYLPGTIPRPEYFPVRNRIISGLAKAVLVVEAAMRSGTLSTARHALEQNRDVYAVPGSTLAETSEGCRELIRRGAGPVFSAEDIIRDLAPVLRPELFEKARAAATAGPGASAGPDAPTAANAELDARSALKAYLPKEQAAK